MIAAGNHKNAKPRKPTRKKLRKSKIGNVIDNKAHPIVNPKMTV